MKFDIDLHVTLILAIAFLLGLMIGLQVEGGLKLIPLAIVFFVPQGRIYIRAFWDYPKFKKQKAPYLIANEFQTISATLVCAKIIGAF